MPLSVSGVSSNTNLYSLVTCSAPERQRLLRAMATIMATTMATIKITTAQTAMMIARGKDRAAAGDVGGGTLDDAITVTGHMVKQQQY